jgi:hypothetical protein
MRMRGFSVAGLKFRIGWLIDRVLSPLAQQEPYNFLQTNNSRDYMNLWLIKYCPEGEGTIGEREIITWIRSFFKV